VEHEYGASEIQVLEGLEAVRKRPGMYIGSTSSSGLHHLVYEIVDNAIDEALAGYCTEIQVGIEPGNIIRVVDNGRGIPVDIQKQTGKPALEVVFTILHAGGKFGGGGYKVSGGLHGVGASVVNALSQWLEVRVHKDGQIYEMKFARGQVTQPMQVVGQTDRTGTEVVFQPDPEMFTETTEYDYETLHTRMREEAFLNAGLSITIADRRGEEVISETMCYEGGIREFVTYINRNKTPIHDGVIYMAGSREDAMAEVSLQYNDSYNEIIVSFANNVHTPEGGMHEEGFKRALTNALNAYGRRMKLLKEDEKVSGEDCREGLTCIISVKLTEAQFEGQTKAKLGNSEIRTLVNSIVSEKLEEFLEENPAVGRAILDKALTAARAREAARKSPGIRPPENRAGVGTDARQASGLQRTGPLPHGDLHRGGRFRRRLSHPGPGLPVPGHSPPVGQNAQRGKGPGLTGSMAMTNSAPSSPLWGRGSGRSLTRKNSATTKLSSWPTPT